MVRLSTAFAAVSGAAVASAMLGIDTNQIVSSSVATCLKSSGHSFAVARAFHSTGVPDSNVIASVRNYHAAGFSEVDVYAFPCAGKSASSQMSTLVSYLSTNNVKYGLLWLDIETNPSSGCGWSSDTASNCNYMASLISAAQSAGATVGVYTSNYMWGNIMGSGCSAGAALPLWYAHYDGSPSFGDFTPFGGWTAPTIKQYSDTTTACGISIDQNYASGSNPPPPAPPTTHNPPPPPTTNNPPPPPTTNNPPPPPTSNNPPGPTSGSPTSGGPTSGGPSSGGPSVAGSLRRAPVKGKLDLAGRRAKLQ